MTFDGFNPAAVKPAPLKDERIASNLLVQGDLVVSRSNTPDRVGLAGIYDGRPPNCSYPDLLMRVRPDRSLNVHFLELCLLSAGGRQFFRRAARGTSGSMVKINGELLRSFPLPIPPLVEQEEIVSRISAIAAAAATQRRAWEQLVSLKSALMSALLTGRVRVIPDADAA